MSVPKLGGELSLKVLVVGDGDSQLGIVRTILRELGHEMIGATTGMHDGTLPGVRDGHVSGTMGATLFTEHRPDVVIIDLLAEAGGGYETIEALRCMQDPRWVPIWCIGGSEMREDTEAVALGRGADVYLPRPINLKLLKAHLAQLMRFMVRQRQFVRRRRYLEDYFEAAEGEIKTARTIMDRLLRTQADHSSVMQSWIAPAFKFSGDAMVAERSPDGSLKLLLADGVGHGLSAALNVLPVCRAFQSMAQKGFGLPAMVVELNHTIRRDLPSHRFVAATLVNINAAENSIEVWNGGNPAGFSIDALGDVTDVWSSTHLPLGVVDSDELDPCPECGPLRPDGQLILYSDGAVEALDEGGQAFGEAALLQTLADAPPGVRLEALKFAVVEHLAGRAANDDVTLALFDCNSEFKQARTRRLESEAASAALESEPAAATVWEMALVLESSSLQELDMVPILQEFVGRIDPQWAQSEAAFIQLSDLYTGALERGLLKLDTGIKEQPDGPKAYALERAQSLQALETGAVRITLSRGAADQRLRVGVHESILGSDRATASAEAVFWAEADLQPDTVVPAPLDANGIGPTASQPLPGGIHSTVAVPYDGMDVATVRLRPLAPH